MKPIEFKSLVGDQWRIAVEPSVSAVIAGPIYMSVSAGPASAGTFLTIEQCRAIAHAFTCAADEVETAQSARAGCAMSSDALTSEGRKLIERWQETKKDLAFARQRVSSAECALLNAEIELCRWILPSDAKPGEKIAVWYGDALIQVEVTNADGIVTIRTRGKNSSLT